MLTRIGLFILQQFLHVSCLRFMIANGPTHHLKGELARPDVAIHLQNHCLFRRILIKPDLATPNGVALVHSIGILHDATRFNRWLNKYIFPGATHPHLNK